MDTITTLAIAVDAHREDASRAILAGALILLVLVAAKLAAALRRLWARRRRAELRAARRSLAALRGAGEAGEEAGEPATPAVHRGADETWSPAHDIGDRPVDEALLTDAERADAAHAELAAVDEAIAVFSARIDELLAPYRALLDERQATVLERWTPSTVTDTSELALGELGRMLADAARHAPTDGEVLELEEQVLAELAVDRLLAGELVPA